MEAHQRVEPGRTGRTGWKQWALIVAVILFAILVIQNTEEVNLNFLFIDFTAPLIVALLIAGALGALIGWAAPRVRRGGRG
jgi:uncharacterized integral membrane protein